MYVCLYVPVVFYLIWMVALHVEHHAGKYRFRNFFEDGAMC